MVVGKRELKRAGLWLRAGACWFAAAALLGCNSRNPVTQSSYSGAVSVLLGRGDGTFARPTSCAAGTTLASVNIVDYAGDARQEIVAVDYFSGLLILSADPP